MSTHAVIAARGGETAKSRVGPALDAAARAELVAAMLCDMIEALAGSSQIGAVHVVTPTPELAEAARAAGARVLLEAEPKGINAAFDAVRAEIRAAEPEAVIAALPGDLPLIDRGEIEQALAQLAPGAAVLVPASADGGTGAVIVHAAAPFVFHFGADSFRRHCAGAVAAGLEPVVVHAPSLGLDIDRPEDLEAVSRRAAGGRTARLLEQHFSIMEASR
ncbi:MAG: hypothetical protein JWQ97_3854 [Phenylobacterium sp.]|nr:hypothetical protein [Phenylobacterium sp.]